MKEHMKIASVVLSTIRHIKKS